MCAGDTTGEKKRQIVSGGAVEKLREFLASKVDDRVHTAVVALSFLTLVGAENTAENAETYKEAEATA